MKKNIKILFTLLMAFTIMLPFGVVRATNYGSSISFATVPSGGNGNSGNSNFTGYGQGTVGVRLTLLDKDGNHIANSVNFMSQNKTTDLGSKSIYVASSNTDRFSTLNLSRLTWVNCGKSFKPVGIAGSFENNNTKNTICKTTYRYYTADQNGDNKEKYAYNILSSISGFDFSSVSTAFEGNVLNNLSNLKNFISTVFGVTYNENDSNSRYWFILVEPIITIDASGGNWAVGTVTEFDKSIGNISLWSNRGLPEYDTPYMNYSYLYFTDNKTSDPNVIFNPKKGGPSLPSVSSGAGANNTTNLQLVNSVKEINLTVKATQSISGWNSYGAGLIWIGGYAKLEDKCANHKSEFPMVYNDAYYEYNGPDETTLQSNDIVATKCGVNKGPVCSKYKDTDYKFVDYETSVSGSNKVISTAYIWKDTGYNYSRKKANDRVKITSEHNTAAKKAKYVRETCGAIGGNYVCGDYCDDESEWKGQKLWKNTGWKCVDKDSRFIGSATVDDVRKLCGELETYKCSQIGSTWNGGTIWKDGWIYDNSKGSNTVKSTDTIGTVRSTCGKQLTCKDFYDTSEDFKNVILYSGASATNCCLNYETLYANNPDMLTRLYRDHPECYSCTYTEKGINATCSSGSNYSSTGDKFGRGTATYDEQTCAYYISAGKVNTSSSNLVTRRVINQSCKVVCTETVNIQFPLVAQKYYRKGSYIIWPTNVALGETESQLVLSGEAKCWYYVNKVRLNNLYKSDSSTANMEFKQCIDDVYYTYKNNKNIISYDLRGNFAVKYNDSEYGSEVRLTRDQIENVSYNHSSLYSNNENILNNLKNNGGSKAYIDTFVSLVETINYTVKQTVNYKIDPAYGYNYIYHNKFYTKNMWGTNAIDIGQSVLGLKNKPYNDGKLEIDYNSIGGGSKTYSNTTQTYGTCKYVTTDNDIHVCPIGTKNVSMPLDEIMIRESLSYDEAVSKYCDLSDMTVCDSNTYHAGKPILKSCYDNETCRELTCNIHECTDREGTCHILNDCMTRQVEDYGKTLEEAKKNCTNRFCDGSFGNIEYRVIDLENPFPGNQASVGSSRLFNTDIQGRKPGTNWNSINLVKKEILNNRGVIGDNIYKETPLYEFELTPSVIKKIREYNDKHEYDDFTLSCKENNKQACVADGFNFRSKDYGNVSVINNCNSINDITSFNNCYNNDRLG